MNEPQIWVESVKCAHIKHQIQYVSLFNIKKNILYSSS